MRKLRSVALFDSIKTRSSLPKLLDELQPVLDADFSKISIRPDELVDTVEGIQALFQAEERLVDRFSVSRAEAGRRPVETNIVRGVARQIIEQLMPPLREKASDPAQEFAWAWRELLPMFEQFERDPTQLAHAPLRRLQVLADKAAQQVAAGKNSNHQSEENPSGARSGSSSSHEGSASRPRSGQRDPFEILGIKRGATRSAVTQAFRQLIAKYHPDKVASLGEELQKLALEKTQEINAAYTKCLKSCKD